LQRSEQDELAISFQHMIDTITLLIGEFNGLAEAAVDGRLDVRADASQFRGDFTQIVEGVNNTLNAVIGPLNVAAEYMDRLARGDVPPQITDEYRGDFMAIKNNLNGLIHSTRDTTAIAQQIAEGNLGVTVELRSEQDEMMLALRRMVEYLQHVAAVAEQIANQELQMKITPQSDNDVLNKALQRMVGTLQTMVHEVETSMRDAQQHSWLMTGQAELAAVIRGEQEITRLAQNIVGYLVKYLDASVGALYLARREDGETVLRLTGSYAYTHRKGACNVFKLGEHRVGQAALEQENILYTNVPDDYLLRCPESAETASGQVIVTPFSYEGELQGVIELGRSDVFHDVHIDFLKQVTESIAIAFNTALTRLKMQKLLNTANRKA